MRLSLCALTVAALALVSTEAKAGPVAPGGSIALPSGVNFVPPTGDLLSSDSRTLDLTYMPPAGKEFTPAQTTSTSVTFTSEVRRDAGTGKLSFLYKLEPIAGNLFGEEGATAAYSAFASFATDVTGEAFTQGVTVDRSADGTTLTANGGNQGLGHPPIIAVATDATNFDSNGSLTLSLTNELRFQDIGNPDTAINGDATATATFGGIFEPIAGTQPPPPPTGIPLPPAAWTGLLTLGVVGAAVGLRRRLAIG